MVKTLNLEKLASSELREDPFTFVVVKDFIHKDALDRVRASFPSVPGPGSHPPDGLTIEGEFKTLIQDFESREFREAIEKKFAIDLASKPFMYTVRGACRAKDGQIHTDTKSKIVTVLIYLNDDRWDNSAGRLRLLRNGTDLENYVTEIEPAGGTLLVFVRSENSWHGHHSYEGPRRALQFNWVTDQAVVDREQSRHKLSAFFKRLMH